MIVLLLELRWKWLLIDQINAILLWRVFRRLNLVHERVALQHFEVIQLELELINSSQLTQIIEVIVLQVELFALVAIRWAGQVVWVVAFRLLQKIVDHGIALVLIIEQLVVELLNFINRIVLDVARRVNLLRDYGDLLLLLDLLFRADLAHVLEGALVFQRRFIEVADANLRVLELLLLWFKLFRSRVFDLGALHGALVEVLSFDMILFFYFSKLVLILKLHLEFLALDHIAFLVALVLLLRFLFGCLLFLRGAEVKVVRAQVVPEVWHAFDWCLLDRLFVTGTHAPSFARAPLIWALVGLRWSLPGLFLRLVLLLRHHLVRNQLVRHILYALLYLFILLKHFLIVLHELSLWSVQHIDVILFLLHRVVNRILTDLFGLLLILQILRARRQYSQILLGNLLLLLFQQFLLLVLTLLALLDVVECNVWDSEQALHADVISGSLLCVAVRLFVALRCLFVALACTRLRGMIYQLRWHLLLRIVFIVAYFLLFTAVLHLLHFFELLYFISNLIGAIQAFFEIVEETLEWVSMRVPLTLDKLFNLLFLRDVLFHALTLTFLQVLLVAGCAIHVMVPAPLIVAPAVWAIASLTALLSLLELLSEKVDLNFETVIASLFLLVLF